MVCFLDRDCSRIHIYLVCQFCAVSAQCPTPFPQARAEALGKRPPALSGGTERCNKVGAPLKPPFGLSGTSRESYPGMALVPHICPHKPTPHAIPHAVRANVGKFPCPDRQRVSHLDLALSGCTGDHASPSITLRAVIPSEGDQAPAREPESRDPYVFCGCPIFARTNQRRIPSRMRCGQMWGSFPARIPEHYFLGCHPERGRPSASAVARVEGPLYFLWVPHICPHKPTPHTTPHTVRANVGKFPCPHPRTLLSRLSSRARATKRQRGSLSRGTCVFFAGAP